MTELISFGVDIMARNYNPQGDTTLHNAMVRSKQLEDNVKNATGPSVAKSRFTTTYWRAWNTELVDLEDLCRKENATAASVVAQQEAAAACQAAKEKAMKKKKLAGRINSKLPGITFADPNKNDGRPSYFDLHLMGSRNSMLKIHEYLEKPTVPASYFDPSTLIAADGVDPLSISRAVLRGGVLSLGPSRASPQRSATSLCDFPPVDVPKGSPKMLSFGNAPRFSYVKGVDGSSTDDVSGGQSNAGIDGIGGKAYDAARVRVYDGGGPRYSFPREDRSKGGPPVPGVEGPGPGAANVPRLFDGGSAPGTKGGGGKSSKDLGALLHTLLQTDPSYESIPPQDLSKLVVFGFGCSRQEHLLYGRCLDGMCGKRANFEATMLQTSDFARVGTLRPEECSELIPRPAPAAYLLSSPFKSGSKTSAGGLASTSSSPPPPSAISSAVIVVSPPHVGTAEAPHGGDNTANNNKSKKRKDTAVLYSQASSSSSSSNPLRELLNNARREAKAAEHEEEEIRNLDRQLVLLRVPGFVGGGGAMPPLHLAAWMGDVRAIRHMGVLGPDVNMPIGGHTSLGLCVPDGQTPLHLATRRGHVASVVALVSIFGDLLDVDAQDGAGDTCLHIASRAGNRAAVEALVDGGADPSCARNKAGKLPIELARIHGVHQILQLTEDRLKMLAELEALNEATTKLRGTGNAHYSSSSEGARVLLRMQKRRQAKEEELDEWGIPLIMREQKRVQQQQQQQQQLRGQSAGRPRSRTLEFCDKETYSEGLEGVRSNMSLYRVGKKERMLPDALGRHSFTIGYLEDDDKEKDKSQLQFHH
jgi:hypothetical protein